VASVNLFAATLRDIMSALPRARFSHLSQLAARSLVYAPPAGLRTAPEVRNASSGKCVRDISSVQTAALSHTSTLRNDNHMSRLREPAALAAAGPRFRKRSLNSMSTRPPNEASVGEQLRELQRANVERGGTASVDERVIPASVALSFPDLRMTSLDGGIASILEASSFRTVTLVLLAFRSFADQQLASWRAPFVAAFGEDAESASTQIFDVSVNETFAAQMLSGFVQRIQRGKVDSSLHSHTVALNAEAGKEMEEILPSTNRLFGYALLIDGDGKVRFRAAGMATDQSRRVFMAAARELLAEVRPCNPEGARKPRSYKGKGR
jgi:ATP10 protein